MTPVAAPLELYESGLTARRLAMLRHDGSRAALPIARWLGHAGRFDREVLRRAHGPVLDVGCGPGRHLAALRRSGVPARGVDLSASAVRTARRAGGDAVLGSVFDPVPGAGEYGSALLLDGNIGIGGDEVALLRRVAALLRPGGEILVETEPPGAGTWRERVRLELDDRHSAWFPWAHVDVRGIVTAAGTAALDVTELDEREGRWLAVLASR